MIRGARRFGSSSPALRVRIARRVFLLGRDDEGRTRRPEFRTPGSYGWTTIRETIVAPKGAIRMSLFFGVLPCKGELHFDDIEITTESGPTPAEAPCPMVLPPAPAA